MTEETPGNESMQAGPKKESTKADSRPEHPPAEEPDGPGALRPESGSKDRSYTASIYPGNASSIPTELAKRVQELEKAMGEVMGNVQVWLLIQAGSGKYGDIDDTLRHAFFKVRRELRNQVKKGKRIALLIDSLGGDAKAAYQLATFLQRYCGGFVAVVPRSAKSAATLLTLGADEIVLSGCGELGPLDAQVYDRQLNQYIPVLDKVKSLERLHASALDALDRSVILLALRSGKDIDSILPLALNFAANITRPLLEKVDVTEYTRMSRQLKRGEDYATRLLERYPDYEEVKPKSNDDSMRGGIHESEQDAVLMAGDEHENYLLALDQERKQDVQKQNARLLAQHLVGAYPDHTFAIDIEEASRSIDLPQIKREPSGELSSILDELYEILTEQVRTELTAVGRVVERRA